MLLLLKCSERFASIFPKLRWATIDVVHCFLSILINLLSMQMMTNLFEHTSAHWAKYSDYAWQQADDENMYLLPTADAVPTVYDTIHTANPFQLIRQFQRFGHALCRFHLGNQKGKPFLTGSLNFGQMLHELSCKQELRVERGTVRLKIVQPHLTIFAKRLAFFFGQAKVGQKVIPVVVVGELHGGGSHFPLQQKSSYVFEGFPFKP